MPRPKLNIKGATFARGATYSRVITVGGVVVEPYLKGMKPLKLVKHVRLDN